VFNKNGKTRLNQNMNKFKHSIIDVVFGSSSQVRLGWCSHIVEGGSLCGQAHLYFPLPWPFKAKVQRKGSGIDQFIINQSAQ
jgi:hypothetical protein